MDNLSTAGSADINSQIGALELGEHLERPSDGVLETAGARPGTPTQYNLCTSPMDNRCVSGV
jgi:hypothetical protein